VTNWTRCFTYQSDSFYRRRFVNIYYGDIQFRAPDGLETFKRVGQSITVIGSVNAFFNSRPKLEFVNVEGEYSSATTSSVQEFIADEFGDAAVLVDGFDKTVDNLDPNGNWRP